MYKVMKPTRSFKALAKTYQTRYTAEADAPSWYVSRKYDGKYHQIIVDSGSIEVYTSGAKQLLLPELKDYIRSHIGSINVVLHCEFLGKTEGKMGDRHAVTEQTTWLANQRKAITNSIEGCTWRVFDLVMIDEPNLAYVPRQGLLEQLIVERPQSPLQPGKLQSKPVTLAEAEVIARKERALGWEGSVATHTDHTNCDVPRTPYKLKLKAYGKAEGILVAIAPGRGRASRQAGTLTVQHPDFGLVTIGSGWSDATAKAWLLNQEALLGSLVLFTYESLKGSTPQQCIYQGGI